MIDEMRLLVLVVEAGSLSKAARLRNVAVSSVTRKIDQLEAELGVKLLRRNSRSMMLTDAGQQFIVSVRHILRELDDVKVALADSQTNLSGILTVTAPSSFGRRHVLQAATRFMKLYPQIEIELHLNDRMIDLVEQRIDIAVRIGLLPDSDLVATPIAPIRRIVCASPDYLDKNGSPLVPEDLLKHNCLTVASLPVPTGWWSFLGSNSRSNQGTSLPVRGSFRSNDTEALLKVAVEGLGIVHLASWLVSDKIASGELVPLLTAFELTSKNAIHAVRLPGRSHNLRAKLFINHLKQEFGEPAYWDNDIS